MKLIGVRAEESPRRAATWREVTPWRYGGGIAVLPLLSWTLLDVWTYIWRYSVSYCPLYDEGWDRLGCVGCPQAGRHRVTQFQRWPHIERVWRKGIVRYWERRVRENPSSHILRFTSGEEYF